MKIKIINTTTSSKENATYIAKLLVSKKLSPFIKTIPKNVQDCKNLILKHHHYNVPEIITTDGETISKDYKNWFIKFFFCH